MPQISKKSTAMPASAIRKFVPLSDAAKADGVKVYHLNVGAPDIKSPKCALDAVAEKCRTLDHISYTNSAGFMELRNAPETVSPKDNESNTRYLIAEFFREHMRRGEMVDAHIEGRVVIAEQ